MVFPVATYRYNSWTIKNAECQRIDAFELWYWRWLLRVLCTAGRPNPVNSKEINPEYSLEEVMLKLKIQYFGNLMQRVNWLAKTLMLGKTEGRMKEDEGDEGGRDCWMASLAQWTWVWANCGRWWKTGKPGVLQSMGSQRVRHDWATEQQQLKLYAS